MPRISAFQKGQSEAIIIKITISENDEYDGNNDYVDDVDDDDNDDDDAIVDNDNDDFFFFFIHFYKQRYAVSQIILIEPQ